MISCQSDGCAPIAVAFDKGARFAEKFENAATIASGVRVPVAVGDFMILDAVRASGGSAIAVPERAIEPWMTKAIGLEGVSFCPEAAVCLAALEQLLASGDIQRDERIVLFTRAPPRSILRLCRSRSRWLIFASRSIGPLLRSRCLADGSAGMAHRPRATAYAIRAAHWQSVAAPGGPMRNTGIRGPRESRLSSCARRPGETIVRSP